MEKYDDLDLAILRELREDSKQSIRELVKKIGSHPNTLMQRIKRLEQNKVIIKYSIDVDYRQIGYDIHAVALIKVKKGKVGDTNQLSPITDLPEVQAVYASAGSYDVVCLIRAKTRDHLTEVLKKIQETEILIRSNTLLVLYTYKHPYEFNPLLNTGYKNIR
ncbi:MAG: Lrp/AsnC family transcriptional regulator [Candidatus Micrarchaeota archaeon]|nr:Lrp/AsnC family transcriptional regulator [Candidatus Micrarchaeota archaeon]